MRWRVVKCNEIGVEFHTYFFTVKFIQDNGSVYFKEFSRNLTRQYVLRLVSDLRKERTSSL